jgi:serine/threonine protein kinase
LVQEEMRVLSSLKHESIVRLLDTVYAGNCIYFVMEYASGGSLVQHVYSRPDHRLPLSEALSLFRQMVGALDYCHRRRIVHRDLKPENILMDAEGACRLLTFCLYIRC